MIKIRNLSVSYRNKPILVNLSEDFLKNEFICIIGKNGSGKSTLLRAISGMIPYKGNIILSNNEIKKMNLTQRSKLLAYLPQNRPIPSIETYNLVAHGRYTHMGFSKILSPYDKEIINNSINQAGVSDLTQRDVKTLSGGERQRVYLAMLLAQCTDFLLLDEPTTYLDIDYQLQTMELLKKMHQSGKCIIMVAHDLAQAFHYSSKICLLAEPSKIIYQTPRELCGNTIFKKIMGVDIERSNDNGIYKYRLTKG